MAEKQKLLIEIVGDATGLKRTIDESERKTQSFAGKLGGLGKVAALTGGAAGVGLLVEGLKGALEAAQKDEQQIAKFTAAVKASGGYLPLWTKALENARDAGRTLGFTNEETTAAMTRFAAAGETQKKAMEDLTVAENLARLKHIGLADAAVQLVKVHAGAARLMKEFGQTVVPVTTRVDALKEKYKALKQPIDAVALAQAKAADKAATAANSFDIIKGKLAGQADAYSKTAAGGMAQFSAQLDNIKTKIGEKLLPVFERVMAWVNANWPEISRVVDQAMQMIGRASDAAKPFLQSFITILRGVIEIVKGLLTGDWSQAWNGVKTLVSGVFQQITAVVSGFVNLLTAILTPAMNVVKTTAALVWNDVKNVIVGAFTAVKGAYESTWANIESGLKAGWNSLKTAADTAWAAIKTAITAVFSAIRTYYETQWNVVRSGLTSAWNALSSLASSAWGGIRSAAAGALSAIKTAYDNSFAPAISGIRTGLSWIRDNAAGAWNVLSRAVSAVSGAIGTVLSAISAAINAVVSALQKLKSLYDSLKGIITGPPTSRQAPGAPPSQRRGVKTFAVGGPVPGGAGQPVPILAHAGEYVINAASTRKLGDSFLNSLNSYQSGGKVNPTTGLADTPAMRASAMWINDYGADKYNKDVATALIGAIGPRAQAQAALRRTTVDGYELHQGMWRAPMPDPRMVALLSAQFPGLVFEPGTGGQQISAGQALSRITGGIGAIGGLIQSSMGLTGPSSKLERMTSHAVHFASGYLTAANALKYKRTLSGQIKQYPSFIPPGAPPDITGYLPSSIPTLATGGRLLTDGLYYGHKGETVVPAGRGGGITVHFNGPVYGEDQDKVARQIVNSLRDELSRQLLSGADLIPA